MGSIGSTQQETKFKAALAGSRLKLGSRLAGMSDRCGSCLRFGAGACNAKASRHQGDVTLLHEPKLS